MSSMLRGLLVLGLGVASIVLGAPSLTSAQTASSLPVPDSPSRSALAISPAIVEYVLQPGVKKEFTLRITNMTTVPLPISGSVKNFVPLEGVASASSRKLFDASQWFVITEPDFILQARQTREVKVSITPPQGAEPGGHYATVYFQPLLPAGVLTPSTAYLSARVGSLAFLIVSGNYEEKLSLKELRTASLHQSGPINLDLKLHNTGTIHLLPNSKMMIRDWHGQKVAEVPFNPGIILPGTQKRYTATWENPPLFGYYTATLESTYGSENTKVHPGRVDFWVIPWALLLVIMIPVGLVGLIAVRTRGRWKAAWNILLDKK